MAMREQQAEHRSSPPLKTARAASDQEPQLPRSAGPITGQGGSAAVTTSMATAGDLAGGGDAGEEQRGQEETGPDNVRPPWAALLSAVDPSSLVSLSSQIASPRFQRKRRSHVRRAAAPSHKWAGFKIPVLPPAPAKMKARRNSKPMKKRDKPCALCGTTWASLWRTWPTDRRVGLCNACGIQVRARGVVLPELVYLLPHPATATTTTVVSELQQPVPPPQEIQPAVISDSTREVLPKQVRVNLPPPATATTTVVLPPPATATTTVVLPPPATATTTVVPEVEQPRPQEIQESESPPDSPILDSMLDVDIYLLKRTSRRLQKSPPPPPPPTPPPTTESEPAAAAPAPANKKTKRLCLHCGNTSSLQWRTGPAGEGTLCNPCGVRYRKGLLVPEYRPRESPTFDESVHSNIHLEVLQIRRMQDDPAPPAPYLPVKPRRRRKGKEQPAGPAQVRKKHKGNSSNKEQNQQPAQAQPAAVAVHRRRPAQPAAAQPRPRVGLPRPPPPELPQAAADDDMEQHLQPLPPAGPHAGDDLMMMGLPDPFLFEGPSAPMIVDIEDNDEPVVVNVIDDD